MRDSKEYEDKKRFLKNVITLYGRVVVLEILSDDNIQIYRLHLSKSNKLDKNIEQMISLANKRSIEIVYHTKEELSRISKNGSQDQGVAVDIIAKSYIDATKLESLDRFRLIALDGINNPQNLGMIIRSCAAGNIDGIILPKQNSAKISPLVIKASAGTLFKIPIYHCTKLSDILPKLQDASIYMLSSYANKSIFDVSKSNKEIFILGNESDGVSSEVAKLCNQTLSIPMNRGVESLNVAITAGIVAFLK